VLYLALLSCSLCCRYVKLHVVHVLLFGQIKKELSNCVVLLFLVGFCVLNLITEHGVCKHYIGPIGGLSLLTATAGAAARIHSLH